MLQQKTENGSTTIDKKDLKTTARKAMDQAQGWYETAENVVSKVANTSTDFSKRYPLQSLVLAAGCGFILARLFSRRA